MTNSADYSDFTLLIAGPRHKNITRMIELNRTFFTKIVVSTWDRDDSLEIDGAEIVSKKLPSSMKLAKVHNLQNIYFQVCSVLQGLKKVTTPYVIKTRSDEFFSNIRLIVDSYKIELMENGKPKLFSSNIFIRDVSYRPYHISDHFFIAQTSTLIEGFGDLKKYLEDNDDEFQILTNVTPAEVKIALFYLKACGYKIDVLLKLKPEKAYSVMLREFSIFDVDVTSPYEIYASSVGSIHSLQDFISKDTVINLRRLKSIESLKPASDFILLYERAFKKLKFNIRNLSL